MRAHQILILLALAPAAGCQATECPDGYTKNKDGLCLQDAPFDSGADDADTDSDADSDADTDSDTDSDTDTDADADTDSDSDTDTGAGDDGDSDGYSRDGGDCDDTDAAVHPGAAEADDDADNDCDGYVDEIEVCPSGGDFATIQAGVDAADDGQLVLVCAGTYVENVDFGGNDAVLTSRDGPEVTIIDGDGAAIVVSFVAGESAVAVLSGFTLQNGQGQEGALITDYTGGGVWVSNASPTVTRNIVRQNAAALGAGIFVWGSRANPTISQNVIEDNDGTAGAGAGIQVQDSASATIENNVIARNISKYYAGGIMLGSVDTVSVVNNTIVGNESLGGGLGSGISIYHDASVNIINNIVVAGEGGIGIGGTSEVKIDECGFNDVYDNAGDGTAVAECAVSSNVAVDPVFTSKSGHDYTLQSGSPCVDAGDPDAARNDVDGSRGDMGAFGGPGGAWVP